MTLYFNLNHLRDVVHTTAVEKGWWEDEEYNFGEKLMLMVTELSEAMEEYRKGKAPTEVYYTRSADAKPEGIPIELADVIIRILDLCGKEEIDIDDAVASKVGYNQTRPYRHGGKRA